MECKYEKGCNQTHTCAGLLKTSSQACTLAMVQGCKARVYHTQQHDTDALDCHPQNGSAFYEHSPCPPVMSWNSTYLAAVQACGMLTLVTYYER